jgi:hypothetical protein
MLENDAVGANFDDLWAFLEPRSFAMLRHIDEHKTLVGFVTVHVNVEVQIGQIQ